MRIPDGTQFSYKAFVDGSYLDGLVNQERTGLLWPKEGALTIEGDITESRMIAEVGQNIKKFLSKELDIISTASRQRIEQYVSEKAPHFRHLLKYSEYIEFLSADTSDDKLEDMLNAAN